MVPASSWAAPITGTYSIGGNTTGTGPWTLTSTDTTFSLLRFTLDDPIPFADLSSLSVDYDAVLGGIGGGAPRITVSLDSNGDLIADGFFHIHWGPSPSFVDPTLGPGSTGNLLNNDHGRYDLSPIGGSPFTDYAAALAAAGSFDVLRLSVVLDSFGGNDKTFIIDGVTAADNQVEAEAVPEPASLAVWTMLLGAGVGVCALRRRKAARVG
jgi:hypothetical protein